MSKMTDRIADKQQIIDLAKQQYENKKRSKNPPNIIRLPSNGFIYPKSHPLRSGTVEMRHMTAYDEDIITNSTYIKNGVILEKLLESLVVTPGVNVEDIAVSDQEAMLISARIFAYGEKYEVSLVDPATTNVIDRTINLSELKFKPFKLISDDNGEFDYTFESGVNIKFRYLSAKLTKQIDDDNIISKFLELSIQEVDGNRDKHYIQEFIKFELLTKHSRAIREYMAKNLSGIDFDVEVEGEDGSTFVSRFQFGPDFLWI